MEFPNVYTDAKKRIWTIDISTATLRRLALIKFSFDDLIPKRPDATDPTKANLSAYQDFLDDDLRFAEVLYVCVKDAADKLSITQADFEEGLAGQFNQKAILAFHSAFMDFSQAPRSILLRGLMLQMNKTATAMEKLVVKGNQKLNALAAEMTEEKMDAVIDGAIAKAEASSKPATDTAGSVGLIQAPSP